MSEEKFRQKMARHIADVATQMGMDIRELAIGSGTTREQIRKLLSGDQFMTTRTLYRLAEALGVSPRDLIPQNGSKRKNGNGKLLPPARSR